VATTATTISLQTALYEQAELLAQQLNVSQSRLFEQAIEHFVRSYQHTSSRREAVEVNRQGVESTAQKSVKSKRINQGDIYWVQLANTGAAEAAIPHPYVILQDDLFNHSRIDTVVACALTSNRRRISETPGNILLEPREGNLSRQSVVEVSKVTTLDKAQLGEYIGVLDAQRIEQILAGMRFLQLTYFNR
jgi:mRNA interferase MazF